MSKAPSKKIAIQDPVVQFEQAFEDSLALRAFQRRKEINNAGPEKATDWYRARENQKSLFLKNIDILFD